MLSKQLVRTSLQAVKASTSSASAPTARFVIPSAVRSVQSTRYDATPIRWITSSPMRSDEANSSGLNANQNITNSSSNSNSQSAANDSDLVAVYLSNLSFSVTEELLTEFLKQYSPVVKVDVVRTVEGAARGFGFAKFSTRAEAEAAVEAINGLDFLGRQIVAAISHGRPVISSASNQLFMSGFPTDGEVNEAALRRALQEQIGFQPKIIRFHRFPGGFLKGTGHLEFDSVATLERALVKLQELGPDRPVTVEGHALSLVKARPLLQSRTRGRGGFGGMAGRGGYGAVAGGFTGQYSGPDGYGGQAGYQGYGGPINPSYQSGGYGDYDPKGNNNGPAGY